MNTNITTHPIKLKILDIENKIRLLELELHSLKADPANKRIFDEIDKEKHERKQLIFFGDKNSDLDGDVFADW